MYTRIYIYIYICVYECIYVYICIYTYIYIYIYVYIYIHTHTFCDGVECLGKTRELATYVCFLTHQLFVSMDRSCNANNRVREQRRSAYVVRETAS